MALEFTILFPKNKKILILGNKSGIIYKTAKERSQKMKLIERKDYLDKITGAMGTPDIKVITGVRRSGKSKLLEAFKDYVIGHNENANIIHVNFNLIEFEELNDYHALYDYINSHYSKGRENYVLIDEIQMCKDFEKAINSLHASEKYDIYITGSNAFLLSSDLATLFTGRTFEIKVYPFSFAEYFSYFGGDEIYNAFDKYVLEGGMSGSYLYKDYEAKYNYIEEVFSTLVVRDIRTKYKIRNTALMDRLVDFLMDNISNLTSSRSIANTFNGSNDAINHKTIGAYMEYLCNAFAFYKVRRYDVKGKKYISSNEKYYLSDHSFRYARLGTKNMDYGRILENIVAIELLRRGYEIYAGVLYKKDIDFVAIKRDEKIYIQVSDNIADEKTFEREVSPLLSIGDAYSKMIIARTRHEDCQYEGIKVVDIANWLLKF